MLRKLHAFLGLFSVVFLLILSITGIYLNYPLSFNSGAYQAFEQHPKQVVSVSDSELLLLTKKALFSSTDSGNTFSMLRLPFSADSIVSITPVNGLVYIATRAGLLYRSGLTKKRWVRVDTPDVNEIYSLTYSPNGLCLLSDKGLFIQAKAEWALVQENNSRIDLYYMMKALHSGYAGFAWLKPLFTLAAFATLYLCVSGLLIYVKSPSKLLTKRHK